MARIENKHAARLCHRQGAQRERVESFRHVDRMDNDLPTLRYRRITQPEMNTVPLGEPLAEKKRESAARCGHFDQGRGCTRNRANLSEAAKLRPVGKRNFATR